LKRTEIVAEMERAGRTHTGQDPLFAHVPLSPRTKISKKFGSKAALSAIPMRE
jgi:hypothetical protein